MSFMEEETGPRSPMRGEMVPQEELEEGEIQGSPPPPLIPPPRRASPQVIIGLAAPLSRLPASSIDGNGGPVSMFPASSITGNGGGLSWSSVNRLAPGSLVKLLFEGTSKHHGILDARNCSDPGLVELIGRRYREVYGDSSYNPSKVPLYFVRQCYVEHVLGKPVDYAGIKVWRENVKNRIASKMLELESQPLHDAPLTTEKRSPIYPGMKHKKSLVSSASAKKVVSIPKKLRSGLSTTAADTSLRNASLAQVRLKNVLKDLRVMEKKYEEAEARAKEAIELVGRQVKPSCQALLQLLPVPEPLEDLRGQPLGNIFDEDTRKKECPVCFQCFTTEGWYRLGSCGHEYHLQCLLLHAFCACSCVICKVEIPREFYKTIGHEKNMPSPAAPCSETC